MLSDARHLISEDIANEVTERFPGSISILRHLITIPLPDCCIREDFHLLWNPAPSLLREFTHFTVDRISTDRTFALFVKNGTAFRGKRSTAKVAEILVLHLNP